MTTIRAPELPRATSEGREHPDQSGDAAGPLRIADRELHSGHVDLEAEQIEPVGRAVCGHRRLSREVAAMKPPTRTDSGTATDSLRPERWRSTAGPRRRPYGSQEKVRRIETADGDRDRACPIIKQSNHEPSPATAPARNNLVEVSGLERAREA